MNVDDLLAITDPWKPDNFQVQRYGTRYYRDPLPTCPIAPATDKTWPGFSSIKPSKPFRKTVRWVQADGEVGTRAVPLDLHRALQWLEQDTNPLAVADVAWRQDFLMSARDVDTARGSAIHAFAEAILLGEPVPAWVTDNEDARPYLEHVADFIASHISDVIAIEAVVIDRERGYGGTGDLWAVLADGRTTAYVDWKSRGEESGHGIYEEEVAQGGAYTSAQYMIVPAGSEAVRARMPQADIGLVVSVRPDGWEAYEYDLGVAADAFDAMLDAYRATSESGKLARRAKSGRSILRPAVDLRAALQARIDALRALDAEAVRRLAIRLQVEDIPTLKQSAEHTGDQLARMAELVAEAEATVTFAPPDPPAVQPVEPEIVDAPRHPRNIADEGPDVAPADYDDLRRVFGELDVERRTWVLERAREAQWAGLPVHMAQRPSRRRWAINHAAIAASAIGDDDVVRELVAAVIGTDWPLMPAFSVGSLLGALTIAEADQIGEYAARVADVVARNAPLPLTELARIDLAALAA